MIEKRFIGKDKRLKWEFFFEPSGQPTEVFRALMSEHSDWHWHDYVLSVLPHYVKVPDGYDYETAKQWLAKHSEDVWGFWTFQQVDDDEEKRGPFFAFRSTSDAVLFKLWLE